MLIKSFSNSHVSSFRVATAAIAGAAAAVNGLQLVAVPEPATLGLFAIGGVSLLLAGRKRCRTA